MMTSSFVRGLVLLSVVLVGAGCASPSVETAPSQDVVGQQGQAPSQDAPSNARPEVRERITNPRARFGYIRVAGERELTMDTAEWLTGETARAQALEDSECAVGLPCLPLGFYLRNRSVELEALRVSSEARVILLNGPGMTREMSWGEFQVLYAAWPELQKRVTPFHAELQGGQVISLREQSLEETLAQE